MLREIWRKKGAPPPDLVAVLSYDEKPGIQAIENTAPDLPPVPGKHSAVGRDHEYIRHGTLSLLAGIDQLSGEVLGLVRKRHRSAEFIEFLRLADAHYPAGTRIRVVLDNRSAHISKPTRAFLATLPNRFEFTFSDDAALLATVALLRMAAHRDFSARVTAGLRMLGHNGGYQDEGEGDKGARDHRDEDIQMIMGVEEGSGDFDICGLR